MRRVARECAGVACAFPERVFIAKNSMAENAGYLSFMPQREIAMIAAEDEMTVARMSGGLALAIAVVASLPAARPAKRPSSAAQAAFDRMRNLVGEWSGQDADGRQVKTRFAPIAASTAIMETLDESGMEEMVTIYSLDLDSISLTHYCPTNNQPRMRATPAGGEAGKLVFSFVGAGNLPSLSIGHERKLVMEFQDNDHFTETWTWQSAGKDTQSVFRFVRVRDARK